ncbi:MAG: DUF192 domain-containing protein [Pseudomonadota bacterium]|nr:DUF192 domain-containing protein [Pseudomonadota bacterium]
MTKPAHATCALQGDGSLSTIMKRLRIIAGVFVAAIFLVALQVHAEPALPQDRLDIVTAAGVRHAFAVEIARTQAEKHHGLMYVTDLPKHYGMLFVQSEPETLAMWMKHTLIPLDMLFIGVNGTILRTHEHAAPMSRMSITSEVPVKAVLEVKAGTLDYLGITKGDQVIHAMFAR